MDAYEHLQSGYIEETAWRRKRMWAVRCGFLSAGLIATCVLSSSKMAARSWQDPSRDDLAGIIGGKSGLGFRSGLRFALPYSGFRSSLHRGDQHRGHHDVRQEAKAANWFETQGDDGQPGRQANSNDWLKDFGKLVIGRGKNTGYVEQVHSEQEFDAQLSLSELVVLDLYTDWCEPCKAFAPIYERIAEQWAGKVKFLKMEAQENESTIDLARNVFRAKSVPTFYFFRSGKFVSQVSGVAEAQFRANLEKLLASA